MLPPFFVLTVILILRRVPTTVNLLSHAGGNLSKLSRKLFGWESIDTFRRPVGLLSVGLLCYCGFATVSGLQPNKSVISDILLNRGVGGRCPRNYRREP